MGFEKELERTLSRRKFLAGLGLTVGSVSLARLALLQTRAEELARQPDQVGGVTGFGSGPGDSDSFASLVNGSRGDLIRRNESAWERLGIGGSGTYLRSNGIDVDWADAPSQQEFTDAYARLKPPGTLLDGTDVQLIDGNQNAGTVAFNYKGTITGRPNTGSGNTIGLHADTSQILANSILVQLFNGEEGVAVFTHIPSGVEGANPGGLFGSGFDDAWNDGQQGVSDWSLNGRWPGASFNGLILKNIKQINNIGSIDNLQTVVSGAQVGLPTAIAGAVGNSLPGPNHRHAFSGRFGIGPGYIRDASLAGATPAKFMRLISNNAWTLRRLSVFALTAPVGGTDTYGVINAAGTLQGTAVSLAAGIQENATALQITNLTGGTVYYFAVTARAPTPALDVTLVPEYTMNI